ncbi:MAG: glycosyltransferase family protein [Firmicutes bacterium]|nr:glycosyltransferase family protein [Bacillota bacterium]
MHDAFCFITCVNDERLYPICEKHLDALRIPTGYTIEKIKIVGATGMSEGYNEAMRSSDARYKIYLHQDTFILEPDFLFKILDIFQNPHVGLIGMIGSNKLPVTGLWFHDWRHQYGQVWEYRRPGGFLGLFSKKRTKLLTRGWNRVTKPYVPVLVVDGLLMATQYDIPWREDLNFGFLYYEGPQCLEFIKAGHLVVAPHQAKPWCMHYGNLEERSYAETIRRNVLLDKNLVIFRKEYPEFIG